MAEKDIMSNKLKNKIIVTCIGLSWLILALICWVKPSQVISESERRNLAELPALQIQNVLSGKYMEEFEKYAKDQFPSRFEFRTLKAYARFYLFSQKDNNDIYIEDNYAAKLEYPLKESSIKTATEKFAYLYEKYMKNKDIDLYISVVPDKGYYLGADKGYPSMDYEKLFEIIKNNTKYAEYIDITDVLSIEDYYKTDIHWRQENIIEVAKRIGSSLGITNKLSLNYEKVEANLPFYGVYYGQSALPLKPDDMFYLTNDTIENCIVYNVETNKTTSVYDIEKLAGRDPYDVYLSGATPLLVIDNPNAKTDNELIVFRDSFASSLAPLLLEGYSKVTLVDIRYITSDALGQFIEFNNQDVLFLYSTSILNSSTMLK